MRVITYLLPISGEMLLENLENQTEVSLEAAFVPETYYSDCQAQINWLRKHDVPFRAPSELNSGELRDWVRSFDLDYGISVGYDKKLPEWLYDYPTGGTINFHPSLLPDYRGANPYFWTIRNDEDRTGVTLHYMDGGYDTGPIIKNREISVENGETMGTLFYKLNQIGIELIDELIEQIRSDGKAPAGRPQPEKSDINKAPRVRQRHLRIDWSEAGRTIQRHVRAANPFLGAFTTFKGTRITVYEISLLDQSPSNETDDEPPGRILATPEGPAVRCGDGWARLEVVQVGQGYTASGKEFQSREKKAFEVLDKVI